MTREWQPGDVALRTGCDGTTTRSMIVTGGYDDRPHWKHATSSWNTLEDGPEYGTYRRLVVIDPESPEDVGRLSEALYLAGLVTANNGDGAYRTGAVDRVQAALREFATPTPPKPDEPTGLGAVVADKHGLRWVRCGDASDAPNWRNVGGDGWIDYAAINAVRVLSEGVPS